MNGLLVEDTFAGLEKLPTHENEQQHYRKYNLSSHCFVPLL